VLPLTLTAVGYTVIVINPDPLSILKKLPHSRATGRSTLADVAALAEVTTMTVSRYLREPSRVAPLTAEKIKQALATTGYTPNKQAGGLASGKSPVIAAIIPNVGNTLFAETVQALCEVFQDAGYELLLSATNYDLNREEEQVRAMLGWLPSALIITGRRHTPATLQMMRNARDRGTPVIEMWDKATGSPEATEFIQVGFNHGQAGALMAQHLVDCGYRDLAYVDSGVPEDFRAHERGLGFVHQAQQAGCTAITLVAPQCEPMAAGRATLRTLCETRLPRALAFANDHLAVGAYLHAQSVGLAVPETVAILGFGDLPLATQLGSGISSVATQRYAIGHATAMQVLQALGRGTAGLEAGDVTVDLKPAIVRRSST
jgi:LacI family transcriptional regulator, gluconate utilization system Gnt-I transcriptional repressor